MVINDFHNNFKPSFMGSNDFLEAQFAQIFKQYHVKYDTNLCDNLKNRNGIPVQARPLSDEAFIKENGQAPWDLVNEILKEVHIPYCVNNPLLDNREAVFALKLVDTQNQNTLIDINDLSTGEKVLMSLALAIYNANENVRKPDMLLIDEPDAGLHPSMSKDMINILKKYIVEKNNVPVILTTHSPTTIVAAESIEIYEKVRNESPPRKISKQGAVEILTNDIPFLNISIEKKRTVFVESQYDAWFYGELTKIYYKEVLAQPFFIPARHKKTDGSNCADVKHYVDSLNKNGNPYVYGIVDYDNKNKTNDKIIVVGEGNRYAIENYLLDPLIIGLFIISEKLDANFSTIKRTEIDLLTTGQLQELVNKVLFDLGLQSNNTVSYTLQNGISLLISREFCVFNGHKLESLYKEKYNYLGKYKESDEHKTKMLKWEVIKKVVEDYPKYLPKDLINTLKCIV